MENSSNDEGCAFDSLKIGSRDHDTLKYHLLGPSLTKAGQDQVDQKKVPCYLFYRESFIVSDVIRSRRSSIMHLKAQSILITRRQRTNLSPKKYRKS